MSAADTTRANDFMAEEGDDDVNHQDERQSRGPRNRLNSQEVARFLS